VTKYGFPEDAWAEAIREAEAHLLRCAHERRTTTYGELASAVDAVRLRAYSFAMTAVISESCRAFDEANDTVLASLVCRKDTGMPGEGYFAWGARSGRLEGDPHEWWLAELELVYVRAA